MAAKASNGVPPTSTAPTPSPSQAPRADDRADLSKRSIPLMAFSDGSAASMTGPPLPMPPYLNKEGRAVRRFAVEGNAVLTGGAGTLALSTARALLEHGLSGLVLADKSFPASAQDSVTSLRTDFAGQADIFTAEVDVTSPDSIACCVAQAVRQLRGGEINILVCFAGVVGCQHALDMTHHEWRRVVDVNLTGSFLAAQAVGRVMAGLPPSPSSSHMVAQTQENRAGQATQARIGAKTGGAIVFIASISAHKVNFPQPQAAYNASKAALLSLKASLAAEWAVHGMRVNSVSPGYMDTILNEGPGLAEARAVWNERNPMGRMGMPEEVAGAVVMLCSQAAGSYITGADIVVDGGGCTI